MKALPCPFCGKSARKRVCWGGEADTIPSTAEDVVSLVCQHCGANGPLVAVKIRAKDKTKFNLALKAWNKRAARK